MPFKSASNIPTVCYMCSSECGLLASISTAGRVMVSGNPAHPMNAGDMCPKALMAESLRCSPDRLARPLKRVGARGEGRFEPVSWNEALTDIADRLGTLKRTHGAEALTVLFGEKPDHDVVYWFAQGFGTPNILDHNSLCDTSRRLGFSLTYGDDQERPLPDLQRPLLTDAGLRQTHDCRLLVLFGENPADARRFFWLWSGIRAAKKEGMQLVVVDPFKTRTADLADRWLPIKVGEDGALILAILRYVIECDGHTGKYLDWTFINSYTHGFDELKKDLLTEACDPQNGELLYSINWAAAKTGIAASTIVALAHDMGSIKPACAMVGMNGVAHHYNGFQTTRALAILIAITGNLDVPGGLHLRLRPPLRSLKDDLACALGDQMGKHKDRYSTFPLATHGVTARVPSDILDGIHLHSGPAAGHTYSTRGMFIIHHNPLLTAPESQAWIDAFTARDDQGEYRLELLVFNDIVINDTGLYADYVLPMAHFFERQGVCINETINPVVSLRSAVTNPPAGCRTPRDLYHDLARNMGKCGNYENLFCTENDDDWCDYILEPLLPSCNGASPTERLRMQGGLLALPTRYRKYRDYGFNTTTGHVELVSERIRQASDIGLTHYPAGLVYEPCVAHDSATSPASSDGHRHFHLITGRSYLHSHSITQNLDLPARYRFPVLLINDVEAAECGFVEGETVAVRNARGDEIRATLQRTPRLIRGIVRGQHGFGATSPFLSAKVNGTYNVNQLTDRHNVHPISGNVGFGDTIVTLHKF